MGELLEAEEALLRLVEDDLLEDGSDVFEHVGVGLMLDGGQLILNNLKVYFTLLVTSYRLETV